jgi:hypothetical protein
MFHSEQCGLCVGIYVSSGWQLTPPVAICSHSQLVSSMLWHGASTAICISV